MTIVILAIPFLAVLVACVIVAKTRPWIRIVALVLTIVLFSYIGYGLGIGIERGRFMSSHLHWFREYSAHLNTLAEQGKDDELEATIKEFDARFQPDPLSTTNIQAIMYQILQNRVPTQPAIRPADQGGNVKKQRDAAARIANLISILEDDSNATNHPQLFENSIIQLGHLRAVEAIPLLIKHITFGWNRGIGSAARMRSYEGLNTEGCVAVDALVAIGEPSIQPVLDAARREDIAPVLGDPLFLHYAVKLGSENAINILNNIRFMLMAYVISRIEGPVSKSTERVDAEMKKIEGEKARLVAFRGLFGTL